MQLIFFEDMCRLELAIERINDGEVIDVIDASSCSTGVCIGDFRAIGWSERLASRQSLCYFWRGPTAIRLSGVLIQPNSYTPEVDMDWS